MNAYRLLLAMIVAGSLCACATTDPQPPTAAHQDKVYTTGSRIPVRDGGGSAEVKSVENKQGVDDTMQNRNIYIPPKNPGSM